MLELINEKNLRLSKEVIKSGVEAYYRTKNTNGTSKAQNGEKVRTMTEIVDVDQKPTKKVKKNEFIIEFQDNEIYQFKNLGGISETYQRLESELFSLILKDAVFKSITRVPPNRGFLLSGSPGSGKTILVNCILSYLSKL